MKKIYAARLKAFDRFNDWERQNTVKPDAAACLTAVFELYELVPAEARQRPIEVEGIRKMRESLACLA